MPRPHHHRVPGLEDAAGAAHRRIEVLRADPLEGLLVGEVQDPGAGVQTFEREGVDSRAVFVEMVGGVQVGAGVLLEEHRGRLVRELALVEERREIVAGAVPERRYGAAQGQHPGIEVEGQVDELAAPPADQADRPHQRPGGAPCAQGRRAEVPALA